ncbi:polysaccharide biosynthesis/export family protein [Amylibacter sp.]|nr:polysaccharide biosynthesis/export family protein [Amylibacter sp.]
MKYVVVIIIALNLSGCGVIYQSSLVRDDDNVNVRIVDLTPETVLEANRSTYEPMSWLDISSSVNKIDKTGPKISTIVDPVLDRQRFLDVLERRLPTKLQHQKYLIGVGDIVVLNTPVDQSLVEALNGFLATQNTQQRYTVQDDGAVSVPDIGRIIIGGLTLEEAEDTIYRHMIKMGVAPSFSIAISEFNSQYVSISGNVISPGIEAISLQPLYLDQAIYRRGGIAISDASFVVIRLYRDGSIYQLPGLELYNMNDTKRILLRDGDRIVIEMTDDYDNTLGLGQQARENTLRELEMETEARANEGESLLSRLEYGLILREYVYIIGEVDKQSRYTLPFENMAFLADALLHSGGVSPISGSPKQIYVLRGTSDQINSEIITALHLDVSNAANFILATRLELRPKDVIFVGTQPITNWNRMINQFIPSLGLPDVNIPKF